jgi:Holliday junction resolvase RusA-like endonuclease
LEAPRPIRRRLAIIVVLGPERLGGRYLPMGQAPDPDNLLKALLDAVVDGGWAVDDSEEWLDWERPRILPHDGDGPRTILALEDLA